MDTENCNGLLSAQKPVSRKTGDWTDDRVTVALVTLQYTVYTPDTILQGRALAVLGLEYGLINL
jgi:hypothetical protein